jgi:hypothetical protein
MHAACHIHFLFLFLITLITCGKKYKLCGFLLSFTFSHPLSNIDDIRSACTQDIAICAERVSKKVKTELQTTLPRFELQHSVPYRST